MSFKPRPLSILSLAFALTLSLVLIGCNPTAIRSDQLKGESPEDEHRQINKGEAEILLLPDLAALDLDGALLNVVATTSIIGDVVAQVGGNAINLTTLIGPGQDPHSYQPAAQDLTAVSEAHIIFVNGWDLEEALIQDLTEIAEGKPIVPISANLDPLSYGTADHTHGEKRGKTEREHDEGEDEHQLGSPDPHVWFSIPNVEQWVDNARQVLSDLDPSNAGTYEDNAAVYMAALAELGKFADSQMVQIPKERRYLVTNHDSFSYFAMDYDLTLLGAVIPAASTIAEPSARDLATLIEEMEEHGLCTLFTETTVSDKLAQTIAAELENCNSVQVLPLYSGSVGPPGSGADSYIGMFRHNVETIAKGLR